VAFEDCWQLDFLEGRMPFYSFPTNSFKKLKKYVLITYMFRILFICNFDVCLLAQQSII